MSRLQRRLLAAVGVLSLLVAVAIVVVSNVDRSSASPDAQLTVSERGDDGDASDDTAPDDTDPGPVAAALQAVQGGTALPQTTPPPPPPPPPTEPAPTTTTTAPAALTAKGTAFGPAPETAPRTAVGGDCRSLASPGWTVEECGTATGVGGPVTWLIEEKGKGRRALLLESAGAAGQWRPYLVAGDDLGNRWSGINARVAEGPGGTGDQIIGFGFRLKTTGTLAVDLVHQGQVAAHVELEKGAARVSRSQLDTWAAQADGTYRHDVVRWSADAWRVVDTEVISAALVPPSHL